jgi:hypothetical protein
LLDLDQFAALAFRLLVSSICSELTSSEGKTELIWSWVT